MSSPTLRRFAAVYRCVLKMLRRDRSNVFPLTLIAVGMIAIAVAFRLASDNWQSVGVQTFTGLGLWFLLPIGTLVMASGVYSHLRDGQTLVYLWLRPVSASASVGATWVAILAGLFVLLVVPATVAGWILDLNALAPSLLAVIAYSALGLLFGTLVKRPLLLGAMFVIVWEGVIGSINLSFARLTVRHYVGSLVARVGDPALETGDAGLSIRTENFAASIIVPLCLAAVCYLLTVQRYKNMEVP